jgi:hypothetical protein
MSLFNYLEIELPSKQRWVVAKSIVDFNSGLYKKAIEQSLKKSKHTMNASQSGEDRTSELKYMKQLMGTLAEIYSQEYLKEILSENKLNEDWFVIRYDDVRTDEFKSPNNEYDINVKNTDNSSNYFVEPRSSITYDRSFINGLIGYDIIGPYVSVAKSGEKLNDFYLRPLYEYLDFEKKDYNALNFESLLKSGRINLYIVAGTTKEQMMLNGYNKSMGQGQTNYRVIKIMNSDDSKKFHQTFIKTILPNTAEANPKKD